MTWQDSTIEYLTVCHMSDWTLNYLNTTVLHDTKRMPFQLVVTNTTEHWTFLHDLNWHYVTKNIATGAKSKVASKSKIRHMLSSKVILRNNLHVSAKTSIKGKDNDPGDVGEVEVSWTLPQ